MIKEKINAIFYRIRSIRKISFNRRLARVVFTWIYFIGIVAIGGYSVFGAYTGDEDILKQLDWLLLQWSVGHILLLFSLAWFIKIPRSPIIGSKIQTTGYLYTLLGFIVAILKSGAMEGSFSVDSIMAPIGTAVITSLLGWFLGDLLTEEDEYRTGKSLTAESERLADELASFVEAVQSMHAKYIETIKETNLQFTMAKDVTSQLIMALEPLYSSLRELESTEVFSNFGEGVTQLATNLKAAADAAENTSDYLKQTDVLVDTYEKLIKRMADEK